MKTYKGYSLEEAQGELQRWKGALTAASTGRSYQIGSRQLSRYNLPEIKEQIAFFAQIVEALSTGGTGPRMVLGRMKR